MGALTSMCLSSSKGNTTARTTGSSTSSPLPGQHISIRTFRELRARQTLKNTWRKTETSLILEFSKSIHDQLEEVAKLPTIRMRKF
uniref:AC4 protein n=1 Tax=Sida yellow mosaic virus TaxID=191463 RepID=L7YC60_9GEMI|nr:AC4 protein [Sida yellow mosaic virus]